MTPSDLKYTREHEWARKEGDEVVVGITDHAQEQLGDVVYVELPEVGSHVRSGQPFGVIESVKAASDLFAPISGTVTRVNTALMEKFELVNQSPYADGWMIAVNPDEPGEFDNLLSGVEYDKLLAEES